MLLEHAGADAQGLLFEPNADLLPVLRERFPANARAQVSPLALGAAPGEMPFRIDPVSGERSRLVAGSRAPADRSVAVSTLDIEIDKRGWRHVATAGLA